MATVQHASLSGDGIPPRPPPPPAPPASVPVTSPLEEIRAAWRKLLWSEYEVARLNEYANKNKSMKDDLLRHHRNVSEARAKLNRLLND